MAQGSNFKFEIRGWQRLCACAGWRAAACAHKDTGAKLRQRPYWELLGWDDLSWGAVKTRKSKVTQSTSDRIRDVISDYFLMLWFQKDSLDEVGFRTFFFFS